LHRTAGVRPTGGYADLAAAILANAQLQDDGGATVRLTSFQHISRWARQALIGRGGYQEDLRRLGVRLELENGTISDWKQAAMAIEQMAQQRAGKQLSFWRDVRSTRKLTRGRPSAA
jgi:hypothetical protein